MSQEESIRLHPKPVPVRAVVISCGVAASGSLLLAATGDPVGVVAGLTLAATFGLVAFLCSLSPAPGRIYMELTLEGIHERSVRASRNFRWRDFEDFGVVNDSEGGPEVAFRFSDAYGGRRPGNPFGFRRRFDGLFYSTYGLSARDLADLLNGWRVRHGAKPGAVKEILDDLL